MIRESGDLLFETSHLGREDALEATMTATVRPRLRIRAIPSILFVICYSLFVISPAFAGELRGKVTDPDGRAVAKAEVIVHGATATSSS